MKLYKDVFLFLPWYSATFKLYSYWLSNASNLKDDDAQSRVHLGKKQKKKIVGRIKNLN